MKAANLLATAIRTAKIIVDHASLAPAELARSFNQTVLTALALQVVGHLVGSRLTHVDDGPAGEVVRRDLGHRPLLLLLGCQSRPLRASLEASIDSTAPTLPSQMAAS